MEITTMEKGMHSHYNSGRAEAQGLSSLLIDYYSYHLSINYNNK